MERADALVARARAAPGLGAVGADGWREGLERLVVALDGEARLSPAGAAAMDGQIVHFLSQRLQVEDWYRRHPEIEAEEIVAPLIGLGLPRTGSTALGFLLAQDPAVRVLRNWEAMSPCPPPDAATEGDDPRIAAARAALDARNARFPRMRAMFPSDPEGPTECQTLQAMDFRSQLFQAQARIPSYARWLNWEADLAPTYRFVKRVLKLLQWRCGPRRWRLKNPSNIVFIDAVDAAFPDARYWMTHRDVARVIPSAADLYCEVARAFSDATDPRWMGQLNADCWEAGMRRLIAFRERGHDGRFCDIGFAEMQADPMPPIERLYAFLGEPLTDETRARMRRWREGSPREGGGRGYAAADFGLDEAALRDRFRFYHERFQVPAGETA